MRVRNFAIVLGTLCIFTGNVFGVEIVYPTSQNVTINADSTFFTGNENPEKTLKINDKEIPLSLHGGFFYPVDLKSGENKFKIDNGDEILIYIITRNENVQKQYPETITKYDEPVPFVVIKDNTPLRSFPYDGGITRLQHYSKGVPLNVTGEYDDFYKVQLSADDYAWIDKKSVSEIKGFNNSPANIESFIYEENPEKRIFTIKLSKKVPYILSEKTYYRTKQFKSFEELSDGLDLTIYNVKGYPENKYEIHINRVGLKDFGYKIYYKNNNELILEVKNFPNINPQRPLDGIKVTLDAGHGGMENGAIGALGTLEKDVNLMIVKTLQTKLEKSGAKVFLTRENDDTVDLQTRTELSKKNKSDIFLSIHADSLPNGSKNTNPSGSTAYYYYHHSTDLADKILDSLSSYAGLQNNGVKQESFAVIRNTESPAVLLEVAYMISPSDNEKLIDDKFRETVADAIVKAMEKYFDE